MVEMKEVVSALLKKTTIDPFFDGAVVIVWKDDQHWVQRFGQRGADNKTVKVVKAVEAALDSVLC